MDRDTVNAIHSLYRNGEMDAGELLGRLWCGPDTRPDLDGLAVADGNRMRLDAVLIRFIKATEYQLAGIPRPDFVFGYPLSQPPRQPGEPRPAFVAMPYGPSWFHPISQLVVTTADRHGFCAKVSKDLATPGCITEQIWQGIRCADVVVADITGSNPNVFYELGLAHALGKEVILLAQGIDAPPFDVSTARLLRYELSDLPAFEAQLARAFGSVSARYAYEGAQPEF
ncbi:MAG: hypothetical protein H6945_01690 [Zoogloeaceae bacterium]|nr:hypothetical protein [Rhodocyclaceae bacterium]MCP5234437.1 hypothetical protein [Zoogloeaceae bacterium]